MTFYDGFPQYIPVAEKKRRSAVAAENLKKKNSKVWPIVISGRTIATTWWGKSWCANLESYADYSNRIARGRSYVRHGAVLDLQVEQGTVKALVQGSSSKPYKVVVEVTSLPDELWKTIVKECTGKINSLQELAAGKFPQGLSALFMKRGTGLFPAPEDIEFSCSCPDYAVMCKHVAAVLYGIGARFDDDSGLLFELRKVNMGELITASLAEQSKTLLGKEGRRGRRVLDDSDLAGAFGIDIDVGPSVHTLSNAADEVVKPRRGRPPKKKTIDDHSL